MICFGVLNGKVAELVDGVHRRVGRHKRDDGQTGGKSVLFELLVEGGHFFFFHVEGDGERTTGEVIECLQTLTSDEGEWEGSDNGLI